MENSIDHERYMQRCMELARLGLGESAPNPMVGSVIVYENKIIGEGYHHKFGEPHAEVNAINSVTDKTLLPGSTLYVNLEPCSHFGKTPPCCDLIVRNQIKRVVISNSDPNPLVKGKGLKKLKESGTEVVTDVFKKQGEELNRRFFTFHLKNRPYIILKWAQSPDGFIDVIRNSVKPQQPNWITNEEARMLVHKWRSEEQAIMIGTNTAFIDNPRLNVRLWCGKNPTRIVIDRNLRLPQNIHLFDGSLPTIIFTQKIVEEMEKPNIEYITVPFDDYLPEHVLGELYKRNIQSLIIEGGTRLINSFVNANLWDEARVFTGQKYFNTGIEAPRLEIKSVSYEIWTDFRLDIFKNI
jgi:diaminohydroxyphosphoribosylaminopyrimidine deaminase / 5-amino-6-(5-phosphoribosylamino)uracil reductase